MYLRYTLPLQISNAIPFCKNIFQTLERELFPIKCYINVETITNEIKAYFQTTSLICRRIKPERLNIFEDELRANCTVGADGDIDVNCCITKMVFWVKKLQKTTTKCSLKPRADRYTM